jgi:energy-coupling factor transport system permease protein
MVGLCLGTYSLLDTSTPRFLGAPMLALGVALSAAGLALGGRRIRRTQYRPDPWRFPEWGTAISGVITAATVIAVNVHDASALNPSLFPAAWPALPLIPAAGILCALAPVVCTPPPPLSARPVGRTARALTARRPVGAAA